MIMFITDEDVDIFKLSEGLTYVPSDLPVGDRWQVCMGAISVLYLNLLQHNQCYSDQDVKDFVQALLNHAFIAAENEMKKDHPQEEREEQ